MCHQDSVKAIGSKISPINIMVLMLGEYNIDCILENKLKQIMENWNISR